MRIVVIAVGSRGDIQPYIALGEGLRRAGHTVRVVANQDFEGLITSHGLECWPVALNVQTALQSREATASIEGGGLLRSFKTLAELARKGARLVMETGLEASRGMDALLAGFGGMNGCRASFCGRPRGERATASARSCSACRPPRSGGCSTAPFTAGAPCSMASVPR